MPKKEILIVIGLFLIVGIVAMNISSRHTQIEITYPEHDTVLSEEDFQVDTGNGILKAGESSWDEVRQIYPRGKELGRSTIFEPEDRQCLLTFTREENILTKIHIDGSKLSTSRDIKKGYTPEQIESKYGTAYTSVRKLANDKDFDMIYGVSKENSVIFQIRNDKVERIIVQREVK